MNPLPDPANRAQSTGQSDGAAHCHPGRSLHGGRMPVSTATGGEWALRHGAVAVRCYTGFLDGPPVLLQDSRAVGTPLIVVAVQT
jgi:hypothetical protein